MTAPPIAPHTSDQIAILRPLCIFFMLYVHVNPGFDPAIHSGPMLYLGTVMADILGQTSVAALSLVSGFLLAHGTTRHDAGTMIRSRIQALYLPMLVWSAIFIAAAMGGSILLGHTTEASRAFEELPIDRLILEKLMFLHGAPASQALGFLRDLTASSLLLVPLLRMPGLAVIWFSMALVLGLALFDAMEPVIYRPTIPLFMLAGAAFYRGPGDLRVPPIYAIPAVLMFAALAAVELSRPAMAGDDPGIAANAANVADRAILTAIALTLGGMLVGTRAGKWLREISGAVFLTYLCHTTVISILWAIWRRGIGNETHWAYSFFFILSPVLVMALAIRAGPFLDHLPRPVQIGLRGKARIRDPHGAAAATKSPNV